MTPEQLQRLALSTGAALEIDGKEFNAARRVVPIKAPAPPPTVVPPPPAPIPQPTLTREQVQALLDERDAAWAKQLEQMQALINAPREQPAKPTAWLFKAAYGPGGQITTIRATPEGSKDVSKGNTTENDYVKFEANGVAMPNYGATLQLNLHTADPGEGGTATTNAPTYTAYVAQTVARDNTGLTICDGTNPYAPNAAGPGYKNTAQVSYPEYEGGFGGTETITHTSVSVVATGQILRKAALTAPRIFSAGITPIFPAGSMIYVED